MSKIIGNTTITPYPKSDWAQTDETKPDFIKNKDLVAGAIVPTVQGSDITLNDRGNYPLRNLKIFGHSEQMGTPSPTTPIEISSPPLARVFGENDAELISIDIYPSRCLLERVPTNPGTFNNSPITWKDGNYIDASGKHWWCDEVDFESGVLRKYIKKYEFTGNETWITASSNYTGRMVFYAHNIVGDARLLANRGFCTHYPNGVNSGYSNVFIINSSSSTQMFFNTEFGTLDEFKTFLKYQASNKDAEGNDKYPTPVTVYIALQTPEEIPLTEEELNAYKALAENTSLTTFVNNDGGGLEVTYVADTKKYIDNKFAELQALTLEG